MAKTRGWGWGLLLASALAFGCGAKGGPASSAPDAGSGTTLPPSPPGSPPDGGVPPGTTVPPSGPPDGGYPTGPSPIQTENARPGASGWKLVEASLGMGAYTDRTSYAPGDWVELHAAAPGGATATWGLWRLGYYGGAGGRLLLQGSGLSLPPATDAVMDPSTGAVSARWPTALRFQIPADAVTGTYVVKLSAGAAETQAFLVVREKAPRAPILVTIAVNTYQAYNTWGGTSLYDNFRRSEWSPWHAYAVSFDRPYARGGGTGNYYLNGDHDLVTFMEGQGYDVAYATDVDLEENPKLLLGRRLIVIAGHSEYWTAGMRDAVEAASQTGVNLAFLGANDAYWQVRFASPAHRLLYGYKDYCKLDPYWQTDPAHATCQWRDPAVGRPEDALIGEMFGDWVWTSTPLAVTDASSWVWAGAGVGNGDRIPGVFGDESDRQFASSPDADQVGSGMAEDHMNTLDESQTLVYTPAGRGTVFAAGSLKWCRAVAGAGAWDPRIQQATANVLTLLGGLAPLPAQVKTLALPPGAPKPQFRSGVQVSTVTAALDKPAAVAVAPNGDALVADGNRILRVTPAGSVSLVAGSTDAGDAVGAASDARFSNPRGIAVGPDGTVYVADTWNNKIKAISGGTVRLVAGGALGFADGTGSQAQFNVPSALAWSPSGVLLVADTWNNRIRAVTPQGAVSTFAGTGEGGAGDGPAAQASFNYPFGIAAGPDGTVVVVEAETGMVRTISQGTVDTLVGDLGRIGWTDGPVAQASVSETVGAAISPSGEVVLLDGASARLRALEGGAVITLAGGVGQGDGSGSAAGFGYPRAAAFAPDGSLLVVDPVGHALRRVRLSR